MKIIETLPPGRYQIVQFENGCFGLLDNNCPKYKLMAAGFAKLSDVREMAERLNYRHVWGQ